MKFFFIGFFYSFACVILKRKYKDLRDTLLCLKIQVNDSMNFADRNVPQFDTPEQLFKWLKDRVNYLSDPFDKNDKEPIELLMTMQTLMSGNRTGKCGAGDCDDFTITSLASLLANGFNDVYVILVGRKRSNPVHIYAGVKWKGNIIPFDLTNKNYGDERTNYKYKQVLRFNL